MAVYSILMKKENAHDDPIYCCAWTKVKVNAAGDGNAASKDMIVTGGLDCLVKVWVLENHKLELVHTLERHTMAVVGVALSPDGYTLATTSIDGSLIIWDLMSGQMVHEIQTGSTDLWKATFSPDGYKVLCGSHTGKLFLYELEKGTLERTLDTRGSFALSVAISPNNKYIASGAVDGAVCIFDLAQGKLLHTIDAHSKLVRSVAFSPNSQLLVTASTDGLVKTYNVTSASLQSTLDQKSWVLGVCVSPDGTRVATAGSDGGVRVAAADGLTVLHAFQEHSDTVWAVQFNAKSNKLISVSKDKSIILYECPIPSNIKK